MTQKFVDAAEVAGTRITKDGYLVGHARTARTGIQTYAGWELGKPELERVNVYRPERSVFAKDSLASFAGKPITDNHPDEIVNAENWSDYARGQIGEEVARDGEAVRISLALMDKGLIDKVQAGKRELSVGYRAELEWVDGVAPDGTPFQAIQKNIFVDHVAVVDRGRAGPDFRIGDGAGDGGRDRTNWGATPFCHADQKGADMSDNLRTVMVDGLKVKTTDEGAAAIEKLTKALADAETAKADAIAAKDREIASKDGELAKKDAEIDALKGKVLDDEAIDKRVADRAALIDTARKVAKDVKTDGLTDAEIRRVAVAAVKGEGAIKDKADAYVDAMFDILAEEGSKDTVRDALKGNGFEAPADAIAARDAALEKRINDLKTAWKGE
ncbi:hypothetical protein CSC94_12690 [Zhengella mangrovi]|uniref:DUF2213 domain-containing protein n=1 Tax=Zhengella mangrovi TaxID=1982044 RepID=A0A2G1QM59_9HYPH|nr:DUF2213 domain-containing protein [Zhengella mangrovi]PHP66541.1 hypothetical protein CSC94_12690 [Zhengella mangrovi]